MECLPLVLGMSASDRGGGVAASGLGVYTPWAHLPGQTPAPCGQTADRHYLSATTVADGKKDAPLPLPGRWIRY